MEKNKKILRAIPRKRCVLEPKYCCFIELEEDAEDISDAPPAEIVVREDDVNAMLQSEDVVPESDVSVTFIRPSVVPESKIQRFITGFLILLIASFTSIISASELMNWSPGKSVSAREIQANICSDIRLFALDNHEKQSPDEDNLYQKLKGSLYALNQQLRTKTVLMKSYYKSENQTLNYTFTLHSRCDDKQLIMILYHWRIDETKLNNLILSETRRKLGEMATCPQG